MRDVPTNSAWVASITRAAERDEQRRTNPMTTAKDGTLEARYGKREAARRLKAQKEAQRNAAIFNLTPEQYATSQAVKDGRIVRDDDDGLEMHDNSCGECGHPYKPGDETHYPECSRIDVSQQPAS